MDNDKTEKLINRIRMMLAYGLTDTDVLHDVELLNAHGRDNLFLALQAAKILNHDD